jgi:arylsulfatase A-like enzyme
MLWQNDPYAGGAFAFCHAHEVSLLDVTATTLDIAGVPRPHGMHGRILLGKNADPPRKYAFTARDRCDDAVQRIRAVRSSRYRYIRNFMPEKPFMALHRYKDACYPVVRLMFELHREGKLTPPQKVLMAPRLPDEELYDVANDPYEITNLADSSQPEHQRVKKELRAALLGWIEETGDQGRFPENPQDLEYAIESAKQAWGTAEWRRDGEPR